MSWFSSKKEENEEQIPQLPELPKNEDSLPPLPRHGEIHSPEEYNENQQFLPPHQSKENIKQVIKGADMTKSRFTPLPSISPQESSETSYPYNREQYQEPDSERDYETEKLREIPVKRKITRLEIGPSDERIYERNRTKKEEPIYIRLDKFQATVEAFEDMKNRIKDIEELIVKTKEIRTREEQELEEWERELEIIKSRIDAIDKNIFSKLD
jgi:hypothetical protein